MITLMSSLLLVVPEYLMTARRDVITGNEKSEGFKSILNGIRSVIYPRHTVHLIEFETD